MNLTGSGLKMIGDWKSKVGVPLRDALHVSMEVTGRNGGEACAHTMILMAQSARAMTPEAKKAREVEANPDFVHLMRDDQYKHLRTDEQRKRVFRYRAQARRQPDVVYYRYANRSDQLAKIRNAGLAKRSWMWGLGRLRAGARHAGRPIPGVATMAVHTSPWKYGLTLTNRLSYVLKILPAGWRETVERKAGNKIMAQAVRKLEQQWRAAMGQPKSAKISRPDLVRVFRTAAGV